jgi:hypothetical protein
MITQTSLLHPTAQSNLRMAAFEAAADTAGIQTSYTSSGVFVEWRAINVLRFSDQMGRTITGRVVTAMGPRNFIWMDRLALALAGPSVERVWS